MKPVVKSRITALFSEGTAIDAALKRAVEEALRGHRQAGNPISAWRDGRIVWIPPEEIPVPCHDAARSQDDLTSATQGEKRPMTTQELEQRVVALEQAFARLQAQQVPQPPMAAVAGEEKAAPPDDELIPGVEYPLVIGPLPRKTIRLRAKVRSVRPGRQDLGLSEAEWASLHLEGDDE